MQEPGRAGPTEAIEAVCYVLFNEEDRDKHFLPAELKPNCVERDTTGWEAIKELTGSRIRCRSELAASRLGEIPGRGTRLPPQFAALEEAVYPRGQTIRVFSVASCKKRLRGLSIR